MPDVLDVSDMSDEQDARLGITLLGIERRFP